MRAGVRTKARVLSGIASVAGGLAAVRTLYEHDHADKLKMRKPAKIANLRLKKRKGKKANKAGYKSNGAKDFGNAKENRTRREYNTVFTRNVNDYMIKSGYASGEIRKEYSAHRETGRGFIPLFSVSELMPEARSTASHHSLGRYAQESAGMAETKQALNEMLAGVSAESVYARELDLTTKADAASFKYGRGEGMIKIEYTDPVFVNNQWTYQRIFIRNDKDGSTVYRSTVDKARAGGLETQVRHDDKFNTMYFDSLNGKRDGTGNAYWEAWVNGEIVEEALDRKELKTGDVVEWRLANERESFCGGGGDSDRRNGFEAMYRNPLGAPSGYLPDSVAGYMRPPGLHAAPLSGSYGLR